MMIPSKLRHWLSNRPATQAQQPGWVFYSSLVLLVGFVGLGFWWPDTLEAWAQSAFQFTSEHFGWLYLFATTGFLLFCLAIGLSKYGELRLGADGENPEFSYPSWLGMIFSAGMGVGLVFWGVAEPMSHFVAPPFNSAEPQSPQAASLAMRYSLFHWGFHQWANFALVGLAIAYVRFRLQRPGMISETFRTSLGDKVDGGLGHTINVLAVLSTVFGVATTLGLGVLQINSGLSAVAGVEFGVAPQLKILAGVALVFLLCALLPLERGVRYVSDMNMLLAAALLIFVFFAGPTDFITAAMTNAIGDYFGNMIGMSLVMTPYTGDDWVERWTIFYWAWGLSWAPFVGSFIARISRGRTIREFVIGVIGTPVLLSIVWFATFGGSSLYFELFDQGGIAEAVVTEMSSALFTMLTFLPGAQWVSMLMLLLVVLFVITSANSATFVLGMFTGKGVLTPSRWLRVIWGVIQVLVAGVLLLTGGLTALQTMSIVAAFPFMLLMIFMAAALLRALRTEQRQRELHQALLWARMQQLLDDHEPVVPPESEDNNNAPLGTDSSETPPS